VTSLMPYIYSIFLKIKKKIIKNEAFAEMCQNASLSRVPDKVRIFISKTFISPMFDHLLEPSHQDDSNKWSSISFGE